MGLGGFLISGAKTSKMLPECCHIVAADLRSTLSTKPGRELHLRSGFRLPEGVAPLLAVVWLKVRMTEGQRALFIGCHESSRRRSRRGDLGTKS